ncbi:MAG TPA: FtsX-like permease family protein [Bacteroidales bacterium]|nr:FtsX-like permease family protein [Bacteroidales bacterium]HPJ58340.1 FtsX-like permease family protein [Bacteroidales bacterium]HPR10854.1 FtsX-like permease family protein [Bacteroidales bacterium]HRW84186.1 FtsX-like permease family protein [Bacteroidales bacterium]
MNLLSLVIKELFYRKVNSSIILLTVFIACTASVAIYSLSKASENETRKIMREQGLNLYIFPKGTDLIDFYTVNNLRVFPENYVDVLAESRTFDAVRHLTGILQVKYPEWKDPNGSSHQIMLIGYKDEAMQRFLPQQEIMGTDVEKGTVQVGALLSRNIPEGMPFRIAGSDGRIHEFEISKRLPEGKGMTDQGVAFNLSDLQALICMEGKINKIEALGCVCHDGRIKNARNQVQSVFPDLEVTEISSIAEARENQRLMMNKYGAFLIPFVVLSCLLITGLLFYQNVSARSRETGLLKALGTDKKGILFLFLSKAFILGLAGGIAGFFTGSALAWYFGSEIFRFTAGDIRILWNLFIYTVIIFPLLWMLASWVPALIASQTDAARILSEE